MQAPELEVRLVGGDSDDGKPRLREFLKFLDDLRLYLRAAEEDVAGEDHPPIEYRVSRLAQGSAQVWLEPADPNPLVIQVCARTFGFATRTVANIRRDIPVKTTSHEALTRLHALTQSLRKPSYGSLLFEGHEAVVAPDLTTKVEALLGRVHTSTGSVKGWLEHINAHSDPPVFYVYPAAGPSRVKCVYRRKMVSNLGDFLEKPVIVHGELKHLADGPWPFEIAVTHLEELPSPSTLPKAADVIGSAREITGDLTTQEYLDLLRREAA